jgi:tetratricopeptide (TPR) repeat protein
LTTTEIDRQVAQALEFEPPLSEFTIATTALDDATLQAHADVVTERHREKGLFSVTVLGWSELSRRIKSHDPLIEKYYAFTTLSSVRSAIEAVPERTVRLFTENLRQLGIAAPPLPEGEAPPDRRVDALQSGLAEALERDFSRRYRQDMQRALFPEFIKTDPFRKLAREVLDGALTTLSPGLRREIFFRAARSSALRNEIAESENFLAEGLQFSGAESDLPARARLAEARGDIDDAIKILRDEADPDSRSVLLSILARGRSDQDALAWFADQGISAKDLTANGALTLCQIYLRQENFEAFKHVLSSLTEGLLREYRFFFFFRGAVRFACLLPRPEQAMALTGLPLDVRFARPILPDQQLASELDAARSDLERFLSAAEELELRQAPRCESASNFDPTPISF